MKHIPVIVLSLALAVAAAAAPVRTGPVEAELVAEVASIAPGRPFTVALRMALDPPWHAYWRNPGDSGLAPALEWSLPAGFTAGDLRFPAPVAIATPPFMTYGMEGEVWLLATITPPTELPPEPVTLAAEADWLICDQFCVPGSAELQLVLPVQADSGPAPPSARSGDIAAARERLPREPAGWRFQARQEDDRYRLDVIPPSGRNEPVPAAMFFPNRTGIIRHAAPQVLHRADHGFELELVPEDAKAPPPDTLTGVLALVRGNSRRVYQIEASFSGDSSPFTPTERNTP